MRELTPSRNEIENFHVVIEEAIPEDAESICRIRDEAWLAAYPNEYLGISRNDVLILAQGPNGEYLPRRIKFYRELVEKNDPRHAVYVARSAEDVVGFVSPEIEESGRRRVGQLFVSPTLQGKGIGSKLLQKALEWHGPHTEIYLEVVSYNQDAINFYKSFGFEVIDAEIKPEPGRPSYLKSHLPLTPMLRQAD